VTKRRRKAPLTPHWLADTTISLKGWKVALPVAGAMWLWAHWRGVCAVLLTVLLWAWSGSMVLALVLAGGVYAAMKWRPGRKRGWWDHDTLSTALVDAGVLKRDGEKLPTLSYRGKPQHDDSGTTVVVGMPHRNHRAAVGKIGDIAAELQVPESSLHIYHVEGDPANVVNIYVSKPRDRKQIPAVVASASRVEWSTPIQIAHDVLGKPVTLETSEHNTLVAGRPGSGKTSLSRIILGHYLLDPATAIYLLDGKGSVDDYGAARPMCAQFVSGTDDNAVTETLAMMTTVLDLVRQRNAAGGDHPGVLLLLEEFQDVRAAAHRDARDRLDATLGRIVRMGRAVSVHVLVSTQRPTTDDLPAGTRNLLSQRIALMLRNGQDAALVLGTTPQLALPKRRGQALFTDGGPVAGLELDRLTDEAWRKVCKRAAALRGPFRPTLVALPSPNAAGEWLVDEVTAILRTHGPSPAAKIHGHLSEQTREAVGSERDLGVLLGQQRAFTRGWSGSSRAWRLSETADLSAGGV
jgi:hypothetical protein